MKGLDDMPRREFVWRGCSCTFTIAKVRIAVLDECDVWRATGVVINADDVARTRLGMHEINDTYTLLVSCTAEPNGGAAVIVSSSAFS